MLWILTGWENYQNNIKEVIYVTPTGAEPTENEHFKRATQLLQEGRFQEAIEEAQQVVNCFPDNPRGQFLLAISYDQARDYLNAISCYQAVVALDPKCFNAYFNMGNMYRDLKQDSKACESYQRCIDVDNNHYHQGPYNIYRNTFPCNHLVYHNLYIYNLCHRILCDN